MAFMTNINPEVLASVQLYCSGCHWRGMGTNLTIPTNYPLHCPRCGRRRPLVEARDWQTGQPVRVCVACRPQVEPPGSRPVGEVRKGESAAPEKPVS